MICTITGLIQKCHETAKAKGWWDKKEHEPVRSFGEQVALMHSELSEALEEYRKHGLDPKLWLREEGAANLGGGGEWVYKPEGIASEFADVLIRIFDTCGHYGIPLEEALEAKMAYNETRPYRHGGKKI